MKKIFLLLFLSITIFSCKDNDDDATRPSSDLAIHDFIWRGMNQFYYWQEDVPNLDDNAFTPSQYTNFLKQFNDPEDLFYSLLYDRNVSDRFSWIVDDYEALLSSFRGEGEAYGFEIGDLVRVGQTNQVVLYVGYVIPNSPAADAGMKRGDIIYRFDDVTLNTSNYLVVNNYYRNNTIKLEFATVAGETVTPTGGISTLAIRPVQENPIHFSNVFEYGGKKIGYLTYNSFNNSYHNELNEVFGTFKTEGIEELVLDSRYNGGGSVLTSAYLASMIYGNATTTDHFARLMFNSKNSSENGAYPFYDQANIYDKTTGNATGTKVTINRLTSLTRLYVLMSDGTASASEMIINGLLPYMEVITIGEQSYGKNVGSITLFDSPSFMQSNVNPNHKYAMQPIVFKIFNKNNESNYTEGFIPQFEVLERNYFRDIKPFGNIEEPLLKAALDDMTSGMARFSQEMISPVEALKGIKEKPFTKEMYILPGEQF